MIVLPMLVLVTILVVAFLSTVSTEYQSTQNQVQAADARIFADSAVNLVMSQIQDATGEPSLAWASQPGMIRSFDDEGRAVAAYKLYSSGDLRKAGAFDAEAELISEIPGNWASQEMRHLYTDLNAPAYARRGGSLVAHFPILHPSAVGSAYGSPTALVGELPPVEGCYVDGNHVVLKDGVVSGNPLPMPVQWIYVLKDGTLATMDPATSRVTGAGEVLADGTVNHLVGRVAFWTDDESSKVNINTASEGTFWDRPWTSSRSSATDGDGYELLLAKRMPAQNEFQRYPGHPAMTSLSPIFPSFAGETEVDYKARIYGMIPRVVDGGSRSGTVQMGATTALVVPDADRLYATVDEFFFSATGSPRQENNKGPHLPFVTEDLERARFFLTTVSRAPEVNLFNKPRIALWPLQANTADVDQPSAAIERNAQDRLIAFCSTLGNQTGVPKPYYFQRYNTFTTSQTMGSASSQSPTMDWTEIPRNRDLYAYLQSLTSRSVPGLGGSLLDKYPQTRDQILTQMWDFVRSQVNTFSTAGNPSYYFAPFNPSGMISGQSQVVPLSLPNGTRGFGRFPTITEAALVFYASNPDDPNEVRAVLILEPFNPTPGPPVWSANVRYTAKGLDAFNAGSVNLGFPAEVSNLVTGKDGQSNATALTGLEQATQYYSTTSGKFTNAKTLGHADEELNYTFCSAAIQIPTDKFDFSGGTLKLEIAPGSNPSAVVQTIQLVFPPVARLPKPTVQANAPTYANYDNRIARYAQPSNPNGRFGILEDGKHNLLPLILASDTVRSVEARYAGPARGDLRMFAGLPQVPSSYFEGHGLTDTPLGGAPYSQTLPTAVEAKLVHSLRIDSQTGPADTSSQNGFYNGAGGKSDPRGKLVASAAYNDPNRGDSKRHSTIPVVPRGLQGALMADGVTPGDWDNGVGSIADGPYINPADQASANKSQSSSSLYYAKGGYVNGAGVAESGASFSPNRQIASAVAFGSLPSGLDPGNPDEVKPWQTLLFCRNPAGGDAHPGFGKPLGAAATGLAPPYAMVPDHAFLDLFTMPIVEPYAISEPFSTAGKVNMNYQMVPFTYLTRSTAVRAVLKSTQIMAIPTGEGGRYKFNSKDNPPPDYRYHLNLDEREGTLAGFERRFASKDIFRSASEICDIYLTPGKSVNGGQADAEVTYDEMGDWWGDYLLTGDNVREQPYGHLYPRLTTKSNTFTVHVKAQALKQRRTAAVDEFVDGLDVITSEFRGSFVIERYLDPNADSLVKADGKTATTELDDEGMVGPYKFRIRNVTRFAP
ncbi:Verru_Chthon cassette protein A [Phragmitibacter flavus]|uniref:Verru_Chthon cassette protein A n=1 Tax=Phragmitibacter flavus TaxID=2576071 RepID=A0A5R8KH05_9BACT|nr:Verru_Chthon cassette protein A [Phragmitibacter flavus]